MGQAEEWQDLTNAEIRKLDKDEKTLRTEIVKRRKIKYGKAGNSKLTAMEDAILSSQARKMSELYEGTKNLSWYEKRRKGWKLDDRPPPHIPEGRKKDYHDQARDKNKARSIEIEEHWQRLQSSKNRIEDGERWVNAIGMVNSSLEDLRGLGRETELDKMAWNFWKEEPTSLRCKGGQGHKNRDAETTDEEIRKTRLKKTIQVEDRLADMPPKTGRNIIDSEDSFMFEKTKKNILNHEDTGRKNVEDCEDVVKVKDPNSSQVRKMTSEMHKHTVRERKDAARLTKSEMHYHERSPAGRGKIVKHKRGTPSKLEVKKLRQIFENDIHYRQGGTRSCYHSPVWDLIRGLQDWARRIV